MQGYTKKRIPSDIRIVDACGRRVVLSNLGALSLSVRRPRSLKVDDKGLLAEDTLRSRVSDPVSTSAVVTRTNVGDPGFGGPKVILGPNSSRKMVSLYNNSAVNIVYIKTGIGVSAINNTTRMGPGSYYEFPLPIHTGVVEAVSSAGNSDVFVTEYF